MKRLVAIFLMLMFLCSCKSEEIPHSVVIPELEKVADINNLIFRSRGATSQAPTIGEHFTIVLVNNSKETIIFPSDYNLHLFIREGDGFVEIENKIQYSQNLAIRLVPFSEGGLENIGINPIIPAVTEDTATIRIVVSGNVEGNDSKTVGDRLNPN